MRYQSTLLLSSISNTNNFQMWNLYYNWSNKKGKCHQYDFFRLPFWKSCLIINLVIHKWLGDLLPDLPESHSIYIGQTIIYKTRVKILYKLYIKARHALHITAGMLPHNVPPAAIYLWLCNPVFIYYFSLFSRNAGYISVLFVSVLPLIWMPFVSPNVWHT